MGDAMSAAERERLNGIIHMQEKVIAALTSRRDALELQLEQARHSAEVAGDIVRAIDADRAANGCVDHPGGCGEHCEDCDQAYSRTIWHAPDELWATLVSEHGAGLLCPGCFSDRAKRAGIRIRYEAVAS